MHILRIVLLGIGIFGQVLLAGAKDRPTSRDDKKDRAKSPVAARIEFELVEDLAYRDGKDADAVRNKLDLYIPKVERGFPVLLFVHGGSWRSGNKEMYKKFGEAFASAGIGVVIINYRLSPKVQHPAHVEDVARAFAWTHANIGKYGGRSDWIFPFGHSAGGHLVALLGTDARYLRNEKLSLNDIRGIVAVSGVHELNPTLALFRSAFGDRDAMKEASPIEHVSRRCPPFLLLYGDRDLPFLGKMSEDLKDELRKSRCEVTCKKIDQRNHYTIMGDMVKDTDPARQEVLDFVHKHTEWKPKPRLLERRKRD